MSAQVIKNTFKVGRISYQALRQFIIDHRLGENASIQLNTYDFDDLVLDFRHFHRYAMPTVIKILGIKIEERSYGIARRSVQVTRIIKDKPVKESPFRPGITNSAK
jgi:hypothetical protein